MTCEWAAISTLSWKNYSKTKMMKRIQLEKIFVRWQFKEPPKKDVFMAGQEQCKIAFFVSIRNEVKIRPFWKLDEKVNSYWWWHIGFYSIYFFHFHVCFLWLNHRKLKGQLFTSWESRKVPLLTICRQNGLLHSVKFVRIKTWQVCPISGK